MPPMPSAISARVSSAQQAEALQCMDEGDRGATRVRLALAPGPGSTATPPTGWPAHTPTTYGWSRRCRGPGARSSACPGRWGRARQTSGGGQCRA
jgi:hypothetical protein